MMDEIFGEDNFLCSFVWHKRYAPPPDTKDIGYVHENILAYRKADAFKRNFLKATAAQLGRYKNPDNDPRSAWKAMDYTCRYSAEERPNLYYPITQLNTGEEIWPKKDRVWAFSKEMHEKNVREKRIWWGKNGRNNVPALKNFLSEVQEGLMPNSLLEYDEVGHTDEATKELKEIMDDTKFTPKPTRLIQHFLRIATDPKQKHFVLDSFAGSGTTAHAVLALNAEDGGNRRFILVECEDYADKLTAERVRRVSKGVKGAKDEKLKKGFGGTFSYYELGKPIDMDKMLEGGDLPSFKNLANYAFFTATGETFNPKKVNEKEYYIGSSSTYEVFLLYVPDAEKLRGMALNLDFAQKIEKKFPGKPKLVFAPACFLEEYDLRERNIRFAQLPFEIYRLAE